MCRQMSPYLVCWITICWAVPPVLAQTSNSGLAGWWKFDEGQGLAAADASGNNHNGKLVGPVAWGTSWDGSGALKFTGTDNYVRVENAPKLNPTAGITIAAWLQPNWTGNNRILQKDPNDHQYRLLKEWQDHVVFEIAGVGRLQHAGIPPQGHWTHLAATYDGTFLKMYYNGQQVDAVRASGDIPVSGSPLIIGNKRPGAVAGDEYNGLMDDVRIYSRALSSEEITALVPRNTQAREPDPADGTKAVSTPLLIWTAGHTATFHDVYFGTSAQLTRAQCQGRQLGTVFYPDVTPQTTYYWRVDQVESDGKVVHPGDVWTFTTRPATAYGPNPPDQARWIDPNTIRLTWFPGARAVAHEVYLGAKQEEVARATPNAPGWKGTRLDAVCETPSLERNHTYFWRVDEIDQAGARRVGQVWQFTTGESGGAFRGEYFDNLALQGNPACTRLDRTIDFTWIKTPPAPEVPARGFSVRWTGNLCVPTPGTYTFHATVKGGTRLWVNQAVLVDRWLPHLVAIDYKADIPLQAGVYPITMEWADLQYESTDAMAQLSWESAEMPKRILAAGPLTLAQDSVAPGRQ